MESTNRKEMLQNCFEVIPVIANSTKVIIEEMIYKKNDIGNYLLKDEQDLLSLIEYLEENSAYIHEMVDENTRVDIT
jgi:hypothetical protein